MGGTRRTPAGQREKRALYQDHDLKKQAKKSRWCITKKTQNSYTVYKQSCWISFAVEQSTQIKELEISKPSSFFFSVCCFIVHPPQMLDASAESHRAGT
jgi:hypothetical protein